MFPPGFLTSISHAAGFDEDSFVAAHQAAAPPVSIRVNPAKLMEYGNKLFEGMEKIPWCPTGYYLTERPVFTLDPLLHAGAYYVQEASSMFIGQAVMEVCKNIAVGKALDLCAAPGGKSTHLLSILPEDAVLVTNEVIQLRTSILLENIIKWGTTRSIVTQNDPADFGKLGPSFDLMVVDAPCSGSGLFRRDAGAMKEWSPQAVELCSQRQQRILSDALPALRTGGYLLYSTCSYSPGEDEKILDWLVAGFSMEGVSIDWPNGMEGIVAVPSPQQNVPCYRFYPGKVKGEGFFLALMKKGGDEDPVIKRNPKQKTAAEKLPDSIRPWINEPDTYRYYRHKENIYLMPPAVWEEFLSLRHQLNIRKAGVKLAEDAHGKFNPSHDLSLCTALQKEYFPLYAADKAAAISFLRKDDFALPGVTPKGWVLVTFEGFPLGWLKNVGNRSNNYYPKEWRIRMQSGA
jgi:16S rRNA C967 or C1407 C5-methylase (RsmB/RsmF family)/NOL1/NOP2/fmu family ribosome biogenesis protein